MISESLLRLVIFVTLIATLAALEWARPRREQTLSRRARWPGAALLLGSGALAARLIVPGGVAAFALWADAQGVGLFNMIALPPWAVWVTGLVAFDLAVWAQHVALHRVSFLWPLHRVHHSDVHLDVMSALRFHPGELILSLVYKGAIAVVLGLPVEVVLVAEILLNSFALFNHANIALPEWLDRPLRWLVVTPDMHRVHHSVQQAESLTNFGFCLSVWDRMFGTYQKDPAAGHEAMIIGQRDWRTGGEQGVWSLLIQPFRSSQ